MGDPEVIVTLHGFLKHGCAPGVVRGELVAAMGRESHVSVEI
jgi:hypothetical protein